MTFLKSAGPRSRPTQEMEYCPGEAGSRVGVISGAFGNILVHIFCESSAEPVLIKVMGLYSGSALNRDGPLNYKEKKATSMSSGSCSLGTCVFTRRPTWASSPTAVISARRSSTMTPRCRLTRGPTPKRSLSAVSTVKKLSTTVGTSVVTLWARALHVPRVSPVFCSLRSVKSHQETHSEPLAQDPALGPSPFCFKKEIHNDLSLL